MSIIQKLSEGIINRDLKKEGQALLSKWTATGLLEGLKNEHQKSTMARLLENQAKELLRESSSMGAGDVEGFAAVAFPIVRRVFAGLIANDLVSVQPMSLPSGLIFFLDFKFSPNMGDGSTTLTDRMGNKADKSIYGTDQVGSAITGGVDLVGSSLKESLGGPRDLVGYAYASPTASSGEITDDQAGAAVVATFLLDGSISEANRKLLHYDADLLSVTDSSLGVICMEISSADFPNLDTDNLSAIECRETQAGSGLQGNIMLFLDGQTGVGTLTDSGNHRLIRRLTKKKTKVTNLTANADSVSVVFITNEPGQITAGSTVTATGITGSADLFRFPVKDTVGSNTGEAAGALGAFAYPLEGTGEIPEIDIKVDSIAITAQSKKLKAKWTPELGQDLNAYHNLDAEVELTSILSEQIALEIDREILADLVNGATAATYYWSRSPGLFVNRVTGAEQGASSAAPDFTGTVSEWYETLIETINDVSVQIHRKTLRGGANFVVCSPEVANILEFTSGFRANITADADKGEIGTVKVGSLSRKWDVMVDPYFPRNVVLIGRKGNSFLESGYVYAPYVPLQTTPTIFGPEDFVPRKGVMTRYAKKMVRPDMYGLVIVRGLLGEAGATS